MVIQASTGFNWRNDGRMPTAAKVRDVFYLHKHSIYCIRTSLSRIAMVLFSSRTCKSGPWNNQVLEVYFHQSHLGP